MLVGAHCGVGESVGKKVLFLKVGTSVGKSMFQEGDGIRALNSSGNQKDLAALLARKTHLLF